MVERIRLLLQARQLSPTQFADAIGVARPIMSHILGGRNKPSLEVVQKIIAAFPDLSMPWLLTGQGAMLADASATMPPAPSEEPPLVPADKVARRGLRAAKQPTEAPQSKHVASRIRGTAVEAPREAVLQSNQLPIPGLPAAELPNTSHAAPSQPAIQATPSKTIRRVLVFYSDGTFTDFSPAPEGF
ncbi:helix-turn-helix transcriptional regulator [Hymenobacter coalescens]